MIILNPRHMAADINLDKIQFFVDYCNASILAGSHITTAYLPTFKLIALSMDVEVTSPENPDVATVRDATLTNAEKVFVERLFTTNGWVCSFTTRAHLASLVEKANDETTDILLKVLYKFKEGYKGDIFYLSTFAFKERDFEAERLLRLKREFDEQEKLNANTENTDPF